MTPPPATADSNPPTATGDDGGTEMCMTDFPPRGPMSRHASDLPPVTWCPQCRSFLTRATNPALGFHEPTLTDCPEPFDSNERFHWECWFCGFSQVPAEWTFFGGNPTQPVEPGYLGWPEKTLFE